LDYCVFRAGTRDFCSALAAIVSKEQNIFFLTKQYFNSFVPSAQQPGQAFVLGSLSLSVSLRKINIFSPCAFTLIKKNLGKNFLFNNNSRLKRRRFS
jgi:hypothetical protein